MKFDFGEKVYTAPTCPKCQFVGNWLGMDTYVCEETVVLKTDNGDHHIRSFGVRDLAQTFVGLSEPGIRGKAIQLSPETLIGFLAINIAGLIKKSENQNV